MENRTGSGLYFGTMTRMTRSSRKTGTTESGKRGPETGWVSFTMPIRLGTKAIGKIT